MKFFFVRPPHSSKYRHFELALRGRFVDSDLQSHDARLEFVTEARVGPLPPIYNCLYARVDCVKESPAVEAAVRVLSGVTSFTVPALGKARRRLSVVPDSLGLYRVVLPTSESGPLSLEGAPWTFGADPSRHVALWVTLGRVYDVPERSEVFRVHSTGYCLWTESATTQMVNAGVDHEWFESLDASPVLYYPSLLRRKVGGRRLFEQAIQTVRESYGADAAELWQREWDEVVKKDGPPVD